MSARVGGLEEGWRRWGMGRKKAGKRVVISSSSSFSWMASAAKRRRSEAKE
jgi:hypothetical protein